MKKNYGDFYSRIVLRHINGERTEESLSLLGKFLKEVCGNKYSFRPRQLVRQKTVARKADDGSNGRLVDEDRTFFCSELVVKALKTCKVMVDTD
jgi:hypothetical protein